ncbi:acetyl-CoA hydrolase/transferase family protein [Corynebacterium sp. sy017]|uniref:acetyl-CoA hydrolase/transferase family protein n=1 Tax=unclassified Corynebacterium TaxID=2624378 RepID=UPI0011852220|nr:MULTISPECIES: acetyl-CoA hydrolase/transferase family protein [unclassified Corynebacterium]MBP3089201.1 acetyl-CoA hydrolase/transferase family protein [Corynebacterium sp. sy017]QDZ43142.1 acetyl-CoA hydrolase/transferase family protein [Corynebacterium sp. sy039]TSD91090.1 acetyl-CoA hydrolase/transferase family protein [Corynebacterium sp. SY003]
MSERIANAKLSSKVMTAQEAAQFVNNGDTVGMSGFTGAGYPKALPTAIAERAKEAHARGDEYKINVFTGASTAPDCDGVLAEADAIGLRMPYQSDPILRSKINEGVSEYVDYHLSESGLYVEQGFFGKMDVAIVEAVRITEDGSIVPSSSIGNNVEYLDNAEKIIIEVNSWQSLELEGMADIYRINRLPNRQPIPLTAPEQRIGTTTIDIDLDKVIAVVETDAPDRNAPFKPIDDQSRQIAGHFLDFLEGEVAAGRLSYDGYIMQSGVGNVPNAVMAGLLDSKFENIKAYTEVIQDGMVDLIDAGKMTVASATSFSLSPEYAERMNNEASRYAKQIILRPQQISNHPELVRRLGLIATNGLIEADIYGNVNSTNVVGSRIMNGVGGSADFTRNGFISSFITPSDAKGGAISAIVPFVSHVDHTEQDVKVIITEYGYADLRGLPPRRRAQKIIDIAHPDYRPLLQDYYDRALAYAQENKLMHTPHLLGEALSFHQRFQETGTMKK